jgi:hypothetical protein
VCFLLKILWQFAELDPKISWLITFFLLLCDKESLNSQNKSGFYRKDGVRPNFVVRGRIFWLIWQNNFAKSWQHWLCGKSCSLEKSRAINAHPDGRNFNNFDTKTKLK